MRISTTDPITLKDIPDPEGHPFVVEGQGEAALKIYFENDESRQAYLDISVEHPGKDFTYNLDNPR
ncbi:MAG: hypothetical protein OEW21_06210 [Betaproteobacteria bacterium]|nr:hypothetical protein [Betaproteobacteria bacterium]